MKRHPFTPSGSDDDEAKRSADHGHYTGQTPCANPDANADADADTISPLPGESGIPDIAAPSRPPLSKKSLLAIALVLGSLVAILAFSIHRVAASARRSDGPDSAMTRDRPAATSMQSRKLDIAAGAPSRSSEGSPQASTSRIPEITPTAEETAEPISVHRTGTTAATGSSPSTASKEALPEDAPVLLVSTRPGLQNAATASVRGGDHEPVPSDENPPPDMATRSGPMTATSRNLEEYQRRLRGLMDTLTQSTALASGQARNRPSTQASGNERPAMLGPAGSGIPAGGTAGGSTGGLFGGQLQGSSTPKAIATMLGNLSLTLPKGAAATCALTTKVISATSGLVGCELQRDLYGANGRVVLLERGSHLDGEYRIASVKPGTVRIPVIWTRIRTPYGVTVDLDSPGTGPLGESGIDGYLDNRWMERIGAAMLLSLIDDSVKLIIQNQTNQSNSERQGDTIVLPSTTANTSKLAEKVLDSTINIPPLIYQNPGGIVGIYVARDVDFSSVYELRPTRLDPAVAPTVAPTAAQTAAPRVATARESAP